MRPIHVPGQYRRRNVVWIMELVSKRRQRQLQPENVDIRIVGRFLGYAECDATGTFWAEPLRWPLTDSPLFQCSFYSDLQQLFFMLTLDKTIAVLNMRL